MKTRKILLSLLTLLVNVMAHAYDAKINGIYYYFSAGNKATVTFQNYRSVDSPSDVPSGYHYEEDDIGGDEEYIWVYRYYYSDMTGSITIPSTVTYNGTTYQVTSIGLHAFDNCSGITSITIPNSVTSIGSSAFYGCSDITSITIPNSVTSFGSDAFYGCSGINTVNVKIPDYSGISANSILYSYLPASATWNYYINNELITSLNIPSSVTSVGNGAFYNAKNLTSITIPSSVTSIGSSAFSSCSGITSITIPNSVTSIGSSAFYGCKGTLMVNCNIPNAGNYYSSSFYGSSFTTVTIGNGVTSIGNYAFYGCSSLTSVNIPSSVTSIGKEAFRECSKLTSVTVDLRTPLSIDNYCFSHRSLATLYVPYGCKAVYEATDYWNFGTIVENIEFADATVKALCIANWDSNGDGELNVNEAAAVNNLGGVFKWNQNIQYFNELKHFTGLTNIGSYEFSGCNSLKSIIIPNSVTSIEQEAFINCRSLTSITIPESVTSIKNDAFLYCTNLRKVIIEDIAAWCKILFLSPTSNPLYYANHIYSDANTEIIDLVIPNNVTSISESSFQGCTGLASVTIPNSVTSIGERAFSSCENISSLTIPNSVTNIGRGAFGGCSGLTSVTIPNSVTTIGPAAFQNCTSLAFVILPTSVTGIEDYTFKGCTNLTSIIIPDNVTSIGYAAFEGCTNISSIIIPNSVTSIGVEAFLGCTSLISISIPNSVTSIGTIAFRDCTSLTSVTLNGVTRISNEAFDGCTNLTKAEFASIESLCNTYFGTCGSNPLRYAHHLYIDGEEITDLVIPETVTTIGNSAFQDCSFLTSVTIPNSVVSIGMNSFDGCSNLTTVTIPESVNSIDVGAFVFCSGLTSIFIPNSVTYIGNNAFYECSSLRSVIIDIESPLSIDSGTFANQNNSLYGANATLYVPRGSGAVYKTAYYWENFRAIVEFPNPDVNQDEEVDIVDVVDIARYVVGTPAETFVPILADIDNSGEVNIGDAVCLVNEIAGDQNFARSMAPRHTAAEDMLTLVLQDDNSLSLALQNMREYTAFQFDLYVPEDVDVIQMMLNAQRKQKHQLLYNKVEEGHWRVAAISTSNRTFLNNSGELLSFTLADALGDDVTISDIHFFTQDGGDYTFSDISLSSTTAIANLSLSPSSKGEGTIYDLSGRRMEVSSASMLPRGVYIIDGKKVVIK